MTQRILLLGSQISEDFLKIQSCPGADFIFQQFPF